MYTTTRHLASGSLLTAKFHLIHFTVALNILEKIPFLFTTLISLPLLFNGKDSSEGSADDILTGNLVKSNIRKLGEFILMSLNFSGCGKKFKKSIINPILCLYIVCIYFGAVCKH